ncbi:hypothetical protein [Streptomyces flaveus]|uniref:Uncharacterized protein n=1 Tax=Streptomyces flaveus TaxID=66370 RepID=A0A917QFH1_9ACTN|nr:hypothetical protein [Streptomyces flaveus]GGK48111.1 hypothetical protein GCM10010094_05270 [Streptomyces flaveus]
MATRQQTTQEPPIDLGVPLPEPKPAPGCGVCASLARDREQARRVGDLSKVSDCNIEIRNHSERGHG